MTAGVPPREHGSPVRFISLVKQDHPRSGASRVSNAKVARSTVRICRGSFPARTLFSSPMRHTNNHAYALSVVVEHGSAGMHAAAPLARDIMTEVLRRDPAGRPDDDPAQVADAKP